MYANAHGRTPEAQLAADHVAWPGGCMVGFMLWIDAQWWAFFGAHPECGGERRGNPATHVAFDAWLWKQIVARGPAVEAAS